MICVVGGAGFLGRRVIRKLLSRGHDVVCMDIAGLQLDVPGSQFRSIRVDVCDFESVLSSFLTYRPEIVIHLGFLVGDYSPRQAMRVNVLGSDNCFEAAHLAGVDRVLFSSSIAVNGGQRHYGHRPVVEDDAFVAETQYAVHKVFNEWQAKEYREKHGMTITAIRPANISGVDKILGSVDHVACIVNPAKGISARFKYRDQMRCIVYGDDIAELFTRVAEKRRPAFSVYNSGGETLSLGQLADMVKKYIPDADIAFDHETGSEENQKGAVAYVYDRTRIWEEFGVDYPPFEQRLGQMIEMIRLDTVT
ncbi:MULTISPECIES: NAD(P)-dependent oxidoreductase [unclassified Variovorax]|uniref:NAD-dependent epimerase/dehydratase family protein n=1 Tax=unclassified Variovorax TaxID=663243 RepID=UPI001E62039D|nr:MULTISPECIES: NAD(P)-dependent oxidoreductase [unclassified Variovorax]